MIIIAQDDELEWLQGSTHMGVRLQKFNNSADGTNSRIQPDLGQGAGTDLVSEPGKASGG
ncbi:MAG TPA: hypothetical protein VEG30_18855 [Terriglobales bacterium]|nr:hypothetical protein [Terriglobales bacterium]